RTIGNFAFVFCCASASLAFLGLFLRFATRSIAVFDHLSANAYGIYLVHYIFVTWFQYALLKTEAAAPLKACLVFLGAVALSWILVALLRRIPAIARVI